MLRNKTNPKRPLSMQNKLLLTLVLEPVAGDFHMSIEMIGLQDESQRLIPNGNLIIQPVKVNDGSRRKSSGSVSHTENEAKSGLGDVEREMSSLKSVSVDLVLCSSAIAKYRHRNCPTSEANASKSSDHEPVELKLSVFLADDEADNLARAQTRLRRRDSALFAVQSVHERTISVPKFAMFVPESLVESKVDGRLDSRPMIKKTFVLPERVNKLRVSLLICCLRHPIWLSTFRLLISGTDQHQYTKQVLDWFHSNFLCFQFDQLVEQDNQLVEFHGHEEDIWVTTSRDHQPEAMRLDANMLLSMRKFSLTSNSSTSGTKELENNSEEEENEIGFEYEFVDLETLDNKLPESLRRLRTKFSPKDRRLTLESDDSDLLVDLIQMLVIERLQLSVNEHSVKGKTSGSDGVEVLLRELQAINENSRQLEESERRIQTEIYESTELIRSLMQQLSIANELREYAISRELVAEISMMLSGTQNSAQAFNLNNRSRLNLMKQANCLREKVLFLTGNENDERVS